MSSKTLEMFLSATVSSTTDMCIPAVVRGQLDEFALQVARMFNTGDETLDTFLTEATTQGLHAGYVLEVAGFNIFEIMRQIVERMEHMNLWQKLRFRRAVRTFTRNSFTWCIESMHPEGDYDWYLAYIESMGHDFNSSDTELMALHELYERLDQALQIPELLRSGKSRFISMSVLCNVLVILHTRAKMSPSWQDAPQPVQPWIDKHLRDLRRMLAILPA